MTNKTFSIRVISGLLLVLVSLTSLTGCLASLAGTEPKQADTAKVPDWVFEPPKDSAHLYGVGSAPRIENLALAFSQAEQNGNAHIAQQLRTQVSQINTQDTQVSSTSGQGEQVRRLQSAYTQVKTAPIELEQTVNEQRFAAEDYVYVLQSINRQRLISKLSDKIHTIDEQIRRAASSLTSAIGQPAQVEDWRVYMGLIPLFAQRKQYQDDIDLYSTRQNLATRAGKDILSTENQLNQALGQFGFKVSESSYSHLLASELSRYGLTAKQDGIFTLTTHTSSHNQTQSGRYYQFEEGTLSLIGPDNSHLASWQISARGIDKEQNSAVNKASADWSKKAVNALFSWLTKQS